MKTATSHPDWGLTRLQGLLLLVSEQSATSRVPDCTLTKDQPKQRKLSLRAVTYLRLPWGFTWTVTLNPNQSSEGARRLAGVRQL